MIDSSYIALIVVTLVIGMGASGYVKQQLSKYSKVPMSKGITGAEAARRMLQYYGINDVVVKRGHAGQDFYDPRTRSITLDPDAFDGTSITATATACHEAGHAFQHAQDYLPMKVRSAIVPAVNLASNTWMFLFFAGLASNLVGLQTAAIVMYGIAVVFQFVTLPVEFNASKRAMTYLSETGVLQSEQSGAWSVLRACALTYVAGALTSILQLLWLLGRRDD